MVLSEPKLACTSLGYLGYPGYPGYPNLYYLFHTFKIRYYTLLMGQAQN